MQPTHNRKFMGAVIAVLKTKEIINKEEGEKSTG
jgi:hypothetical protein